MSGRREPGTDAARAAADTPDRLMLLRQDDSGEILGHDLVRHERSQKKTVEIIHRVGCHHAKHVMPWIWAEDRPVSEWLKLSWFAPCRACLPELQDWYPCCGEFGGCDGPCAAFPCWELTT